MNATTAEKLQKLKARHDETRVSNRYQFVDTTQVLESIADIVNLDTMKVQISRRSGTKHHVELELKESTEFLIGGDWTKLKLHLFNSYNGEGALGIHFGLLRFVCMNGLIIGSSIFSHSVRHIQGQAIDTTLSSLSKELRQIDTNKLIKNIRKMDEVRTDLPNTIEVISKATSSPQLQLKALDAYYRPIREADSGTSAWLAYNRVQEVLASPRRGMAGIDSNRKLMDLFLSQYKIGA